MLDLLKSLMEKSLVQYEEAPLSASGRGRGEGSRYRLLETVRQYGWDRLLEAGEEEAMRGRHLAYYLALAEAAEPELWRDATWLERLEAEHDNLRAALEWCAAAVGSGQWVVDSPADGGPTGAGPLSELSTTHYPLTTALTEESLALSRQQGCRWLTSLGLSHLADLALATSQTERARALLEESLAIHDEFANKAAMASTLSSLALLAAETGDPARATALYQESLAASRECGDRLNSSWALWRLGNLAFARGDYERAKASFEEALTLSVELGHKLNIGLLELAQVAQAQGEQHMVRAILEAGLAGLPERDRRRGLIHPLGALGHIARERGDYDRARALYRDSLRLRQEVGDAFALAQSLEDFAGLAARQGQAQRAARLLGAAEAQCAAIGASPPVAVRAEYLRIVVTARHALGEEAFAAAWAEGRALSLEEALALALESRSDLPGESM